MRDEHEGVGKVRRGQVKEESDTYGLDKKDKS
jgi:hypothetical protein